jgi:ribosomal RNA assembly protein
MFSTELKIPKLRVACLIGKKGVTKRLIERKTNTKLKVSKEGEVLIESDDNFHIYITTNIVKAIGRGFNPEIALELLKDDVGLEVIDMSSIIGKSKDKLKRAKSRLIGTKGKAWKNIERLSNCSISVYGKTVAIIGYSGILHITKIAIEKLISGAVHGNAYRYLEDAMKKQKHL